MRHNKLAGTNFLIRSRKHKPSTFTNSSNNTNTNTNADCNCDSKASTTNNNTLHSKSTYFYRWFRQSLDTVAGDLATKYHKYSYMVPAICGAALLVGGGIILNPTITSTFGGLGDNGQAHAAGESGSATTGSSISITFNKESGGNPNTTTTVESGIVSYIANSFTVDTENIYKYDLIISAAAGRNSQLTGTTYHGIIEGVGTTALSPTKFKENTWGYHFATTDSDIAKPSEQLTYTTLPEFSETLKPQYSSLYDLPDTDSKNFKLTFAARIMGDTRPADHYYTQAMVSAIASAKGVVEGFGGVQTMQEFTSEICKNKVTTGTEGRLEDTRKNADGSTNVYWVAKLKDGNCWMTQNLDYDLNNNITLTPNDSNVASNWTPNTSTMNGADWAWTDSNNGQIQSYDPGLYYINQATSSWTACNTTKDPAKCNRYTPIDNNTTSENLHYAVGNYYNWYAATAGSGSGVSDGQAKNSICPKNWQLPTGGYSGQYMLVIGESKQEALRSSPYFLASSGRASHEGLNNIGNYSLYWAATSSTYNTANAMFFRSDRVDPSGGYDKYFGHSIRCLVLSA